MCFVNCIYPTLLFFCVVISVYVSVVATLICPNNSCAERKSVPFDNRFVANM